MLKDSLTYEEAGIQTSCEPQMCTFSEECEDISETSITSESHGSTSMESNSWGLQPPELLSGCEGAHLPLP